MERTPGQPRKHGIFFALRMTRREGCGASESKGDLFDTLGRARPSRVRPCRRKKASLQGRPPRVHAGMKAHA
eukprot:76441-Chlamydomonas_euryale.AAC.1